MAEAVSELTRIQRDPEQTRILGDFPTLSEGLDYAAQGAAGLNFYAPRGGLEETVTYAELRNRALATGRRLVKAGLQRGERVGVIAETKAAFVEVFFGCQYAGLPHARHVPLLRGLQVPAKGLFVILNDRRSFRIRIRRISDADTVLAGYEWREPMAHERIELRSVLTTAGSI